MGVAAEIRAAQDVVDKAREKAARSEERLERALREEAESHVEMQAARAQLEQAIVRKNPRVDRVLRVFQKPYGGQGFQKP